MADITRIRSGQFSAADSALGYLYQVRIALLWALRRMKTGSNFLVSLETLDDVVFETKSGTPDELLQTKHHRSRVAHLYDASPDLWKSLRIWFEGHASNFIPAGTSLHLLTTATAPVGSAAAHLRSNNRNLDAALQALVTTAQASTNKDNANAYKAFLNMPGTARKAILEMVVVIDAAPSVSDLSQKLQTEIFWAVERQYHEAFLDRLEGWWLRRALKQLVAIAQGDRILAEEIEVQMSDLREQFKHESLPIDDDLLEFTLDEASQLAHTESTFVRQLDLIKASKRRIAAAIRDYYRAFEQRSRWLRNDLLLVGDLDKYERKLIEEWDLVFEAMKDDIGAAAADDVKEKAARDVLKWAEGTTIPIRPRVTEPFVTRGSLHMLADEQRIGWHPEFRDRLAQLLGLRKSSV
jgi:C-terminal domain 7 of the ABC-three component (ABC-3C) systems